jgi:hypothetical protein
VSSKICPDPKPTADWRSGWGLLQVKGYPENDLWDVIPDPEPLNVQSYKHYLDAAANIKDKFTELGDKAVSVVLASDDPKSDIAIGGISETDLEESSAVV